MNSMNSMKAFCHSSRTAILLPVASAGVADAESAYRKNIMLLEITILLRPA